MQVENDFLKVSVSISQIVIGDNDQLVFSRKVFEHVSSQT